MRTVKCSRCGKEKQHHAFGLCSDCYYLTKRPPFKLGICADPTCPRKLRGEVHQPIYARGLCPTCYERHRAAGTLAAYPKKKRDRYVRPLFSSDSLL